MLSKLDTYLYNPRPCTCAASACPAPKSSAVDPLLISSAYSCLSKRLPLGRLLRLGAKPRASRIACSSSSFTLLISSFRASSVSDFLSRVYQKRSFPGIDSHNQSYQHAEFIWILVISKSQASRTQSTALPFQANASTEVTEPSKQLTSPVRYKQRVLLLLVYDII